MGAASSAEATKNGAEAALTQSKADEAEVTKRLEAAQDAVVALNQHTVDLEQGQSNAANALLEGKLHVKRLEDKLLQERSKQSEIQSQLQVAQHEWEEAKAAHLRAL